MQTICIANNTPVTLYLLLIHASYTYHVGHHFIQNTWIHGCGSTRIQITCPSLTEGPLDTKLAIGITIVTGCFNINFIINIGIIGYGSSSCGFILFAWMMIQRRRRWHIARRGATTMTMNATAIRNGSSRSGDNHSIHHA